MDFVVTPAQIEIAETVMSLDVAGASGGWIVTVVLSRPDGAPPQSSTEFSLRALNAGGGELPAIEQPESVLPEAGGSLGMSVNARYVFGGTAPPNVVTVRYGGGSVNFTVAQGTQP